MGRPKIEGREDGLQFTLNLGKSYIDRLRLGKANGTSARATVEKALDEYWKVGSKVWQPPVPEPQTIDDLGPEPDYDRDPKGWYLHNLARVCLQEGNPWDTVLRNGACARVVPKVASWQPIEV